MKTITSVKWLKITFLSLVLGSFLTASAADYCHTLITSNHGAYAYVTMQSLGGNQYQFIFESEDDFLTWSEESNFYADVDGAPGYRVSEHLTQDASNTRKLSATITSDPKPNFYVGTFYVTYADGTHTFEIPTDEDFEAICTTVDVALPEMVSASVDGEPTFNSVLKYLK